MTKGKKWCTMESMMDQSAKLRFEGFEPVSHATAPCGVYALVAKGEVVYVGQARNVYQRLTSHLNNRLRKRQRPSDRFISPGDIRSRKIEYDSVLVKWVPENDLDIVERELILALRPKYNLRVVDPPKRVAVNLAALGIHIRREGDIKRRRVA